MHFNLLRSSYPTVPLYADGYELLASGAFLTSVSVQKNKFFDTLKGPMLCIGPQTVNKPPDR